MKKFLGCLVVSIALCCSGLLAQKDTTLALTPQMGWNTWNKFSCDINEQLIRETVDLMVEKGLKDAGYIYINLDDCWHGERDSLGFIQADPKRFPSGIKKLADYVHSKGLKIGIYSDAGRTTCGGRPGSLGHEYQDAYQYAKWGIDYLKYDWCETQNINPIGAYTLMSNAIRKTGRPMLLSICEWGLSEPWKWAKEVGHSWRTTGDIYNCFSCPPDGNFNAWSVTSILNKQVELDLRKYAGPGHWNDPDMLEVGNGMPVNQDRAHFTMWCMISAPLILGHDIRTMSKQTAEIILNKEVIMIDQDSLGVQGLRYKVINGVEVWFKPLSEGAWAMCLFNPTKENKTLNINWQQYNLEDDVSKRSTDFYRTTYEIRNLWTKKQEGSTLKGRSVEIPAEDVVLYRLTPTSSKNKK